MYVWSGDRHISRLERSKLISKRTVHEYVVALTWGLIRIIRARIMNVRSRPGFD